MHFVKGKTDIDLGDTPVENLFIDTYMPTADGNYVKVYLMGYRFACDPCSSSGFTNERIAKDLNILLSDVLKAWDYWEKKGIIKKHYQNEGSKDDFTVEFLNLKQLIINNCYLPTTEENTEYKNKSYSPSDLTEAMRDERIRDMFHNVQQLMCRPLNPSESLQCLEWLYDFKMSPQVIEEAFRYSIDKKGIKNIKYINAIISNWYDKNINTLEKLHEHLENSDKKYSLYNIVMKAVGSSRNPSKKEKELMNKWFYEYSMPLEVVIKACDTAFVRKPNPTLAYIDGIITDWFKNNIKTIKEIEDDIKKTPPPHRKNAKNKYHNFHQPALKYTNDQLKNMWNKKENI